MNLSDRIGCILHPQNDDRLHHLMTTKEFMGAAFKLTKMLERLDNGGDLTPSDIAYIEEVEKHQKNIHPRWENYIVEGEEHPVFVITKLE